MQDDWQQIVTELYVMDHLTCEIRTEEEQCRRKWDKCAAYMKNKIGTGNDIATQRFIVWMIVFFHYCIMSLLDVLYFFI